MIKLQFESLVVIHDHDEPKLKLHSPISNLMSLQRSKMVTPTLLRKGGPGKGKPQKEIKKKKRKLPKKRPSAGRSFNAKWVEDDDEVSEQIFGLMA